MLYPQENDQKVAQISALKRQNVEMQRQKDAEFSALKRQNVEILTILKVSIVLQSCLTCCNIPFSICVWILLLIIQLAGSQVLGTILGTWLGCHTLEINNIAQINLVQHFASFSVLSGGYDGDAGDIRQGARAPHEKSLVSVCVHGSCLQ